MRASERRGLCALAAALVAVGIGVSCAGPLEDPGRFVYLLADAGARDAGSDAGEDAGEDDAGEVDAGEIDAGDLDAGEDDAGGSDAGPSDAGHTDAGHPDAGHPDAGHVDAGTPDAGCDPVKRYFTPTCATGLCHGADTQQAGLDLQSPGMPGRLIGQPGFGGPGLIIDPAQPDQSLIYTKVSDNPPFNFQMPLGLDPLTPDDVACLRSWVHHAVNAP